MTNVVFDQSLFVKRAIETLVDEGGIGLVLTALMVLVFLAALRATIAVFLSIPLSALAAFIALYVGGSSINTMILAGLALVFSRLIDNAVIVLENIFRHLEMGEPPAVAAEKGGQEVVHRRAGGDADQFGGLLPGHVPLRRQPLSLFGAGAGGGAVALCVVFRRDDGRAAVLRQASSTAPHHAPAPSATTPRRPTTRRPAVMERFNRAFNARFERLLDLVRATGADRRCGGPVWSSPAIAACSSAACCCIRSSASRSFPRTDAGQFVINVKSPSGTRIEVTSRGCRTRRSAGPPHRRAARSRPDRLEHRRARRTSRRSTRATPARTPRPSRWPSTKTTGSAATNTWTACGGHRSGTAAAERLLPVRRHGRRRAQSGTARADRCAVEQREHRRGLQQRPAIWPPRSGKSAGRQRCVYPAGSRLSRRCASTSIASGPHELGLNQREVVYNVITALTSNR